MVLQLYPTTFQESFSLTGNSKQCPTSIPELVQLLGQTAWVVFFFPLDKLPGVDAPEMAVAKGVESNVSSLSSKQSSLGGDRGNVSCPEQSRQGLLLREGFTGMKC